MILANLDQSYYIIFLCNVSNRFISFTQVVWTSLHNVYILTENKIATDDADFDLDAEFICWA